MKKSIRFRVYIGLLALVFAFLSAKGQGTTFGVKGGPNYSSIVGDLTDGVKFRFSGHAGVFAEFDVSYNFKFQPELVYSSQGFQFTTDLAAIDTGGSNTNQNRTRTNVRLNYLTIPLIAKFRLSDKLSLEFGPQFGFLIDQVTLLRGLDGSSNNEADRRTRIGGNFQLDYGGAVGLEIKLTERLHLSPRIYIGLRDRLNALPLAQNVNVAMQLAVGYGFLR